MKRLALALLSWCTVVGPVFATDDVFPRPPELEPAVAFWTRVYTEVDTDAGLIHDRDNLAVVYEAIRLDPEGNRRARIQAVRDSKAHYRDILLRLARGERDDLSEEERRVLALWPDDVTSARLKKAAHGIRFQLGQADKFRAGLVRSGAWEPHIRRTLEEMGLPRELAALPHVESSFNPDAWSRVGAAGLWQFTRSTGRRYMRIDHVVDERMDPFASSRAAARLLQHNHSVTGDWALAITAYNHGLAGVRRAVRQVGSDSIADLVTRYRSRSWGFASRNFYAAFLAAVEVDFHAEKYFGNVRRRDPLQTETVELPFFASVDALERAFDVDRTTLRELNRSLRRPVWEGLKRVPRGYMLRVPKDHGRPGPRELLARLDDDERYYAQIPDKYHRVRRGESLSLIASRYGVSTRELIALNNLGNANFIRAGQQLRLPVPDTPTTLAQNGVYTVQRGDTLSGIAGRVGLNTSTLATINGLDNADTIHPGQKLQVVRQAPAEEATEVAEVIEVTQKVEAGTGNEATATRATEAVITPEPVAVAMNVPMTMEPPEDAATAAESAPAAEDTFPDDSLLARLDALWSRVPGRPARDSQPAGDGEEVAATDSVSTAAVAGEEQPVLAADPSDYSVAADETIEIQAAETLGHYAEWLDLRASQLRRINDMRYGTPVVIGHRLKLDFSRVTPDTFEQRRMGYHEQLQARFFEQFRIADTETVLVRNGDSLWTLARRSDNVPVWLLRQHNPDLDFDALHPGMPVTVPKVERQPSAEEGGTDAVEVAASGMEK